MKTKLTYLLFIFLTAVFVNVSSSQVLLTEDFDYPPMLNIIGMNGWSLSYFESSNRPIPVITPGLVFNGYQGSGIGNCVLVRNDSANGDVIGKNFADNSSGSIYMACMLRVDSLTASANEDFVLCLDKSGSLSDYRNYLFIRKATSNTFFLGVQKSSSKNYSPVQYNKNTTYLVITKYKFTAGSTTNDTVSMFVLTSAIPVTEPAPSITSSAGNDAADIGEVHINNHRYNQYGSGLRKSSVKVDGIRIAKTWSDAVLMAIEQISSEIPKSYELKQNYPNPFNPSTKINFSLPKSGNVNLTVFDINGKVVKELVNKSLTSGTYSVDFDAAGLSSGIYLYRLVTGGTITTKKMSLIK